MQIVLQEVSVPFVLDCNFNSFNLDSLKIILIFVSNKTIYNMETYKLKIVQDTFGCNPRKEWDNLGTMAYKHRNYELGEERISDPIDWLQEKLKLSIKKVREYADANDYSYYSDETKEWLESQFLDKFIGFPLYLYDHSGITMSTTPFGCRWDSGQVGYIYASKKDICKWFQVRKVTDEIIERAKNNLLGEVKEFDQYIRGDVYGFQLIKVTTCSEGHEHEDIEDSCYGFFGDNWKENGMIGHINNDKLGMTVDELEEHLDELEVDYGY